MIIMLPVHLDIQRKKKNKSPIIGEANLLTELFENSGSDLEDLSEGSDYEFVPSDDNNIEASDLESENSQHSNSDNENIIPFELPVNLSTRSRHGQNQAREGNQARLRRPRARRIQRTRPIRQDINYPEDARLGWVMSDENIPIIPEFSAHPGINTDNNEITAVSSPFDIFSFFFDSTVFDLIKVQTNKYARDKMDKEIKKNGFLKPKTLLSLWKGVTISELKLFFAIIIHMSIVIKPTLKHYWSTSVLYSSSFCKKIGMTRDRFLSILSMLHLNNNELYRSRDQADHDPLHKIRPIHDRLINLFSHIYTPKENLTIDEGMCPFRGRLHFRVYIKGKPHKYGIKLFMVCEAESGYCAHFEIYTGKIQEPENEDEAQAQKEGQTVNALVLRLLNKYQSKGYCIYLDRYFSGPILFDSLWEVQTKAVGTVMATRSEMPKKAFKKYKLYKGENIFRRRKHLLAMKWKDKRDVHILSTIHKAEMLPAPSYHHPEDPPKLKPAAILSYNKNKVGVDRSDQLLSYNSFKRKTIKWWKKLFFHLFDLTMTNSRILYNKAHDANISQLTFYEEICNGFVAAAGVDLDKEKETSHHHNPENLRLVGKQHFPVFVPATASKAEGHALRQCRVCADTGKHQTGTRKRFDTKYMCERYDVPLCVVPCFKLYHTKTKYWL